MATPADLFLSAIVTCGPSVPSTSPTEVALNFPPGQVLGFEIVIPAGHSGLTGIALGYGHNPTIPFGGRSFYSGDDDVVSGTVRDNTPGVPWSAFVCNNDLQPHSWEVRMALANMGQVVQTATPPPLPPSLIVATGNAAMEGLPSVPTS